MRLALLDRARGPVDVSVLARSLERTAKTKARTQAIAAAARVPKRTTVSTHNLRRALERVQEKIAENARPETSEERYARTEAMRGNHYPRDVKTKTITIENRGFRPPTPAKQRPTDLVALWDVPGATSLSRNAVMAAVRQAGVVIYTDASGGERISASDYERATEAIAAGSQEHAGKTKQTRGERDARTRARAAKNRDRWMVRSELLERSGLDDRELGRKVTWFVGTDAWKTVPGMDELCIGRKDAERMLKTMDVQ